MAGAPTPNPRGQKPYSATMPTRPAKPINGSVGLAAAAVARGYTGIDHGMGGDVPLSGVNAAGQRVPFINGKSPEQVAEENAAANAPAKTVPGVLKPTFDGKGNLSGGVDEKTGEALTVNSEGKLRGDGKPNPTLLQQIQSQPAAASVPVAAPVAHSDADTAWMQQFGHYPGTASHPIVNAPPTIPTNLGAPLDPAQASAIHDAAGIQPTAPAPQFPSAPARNAGGYVTDAGAQAAANAASAQRFPAAPVYGKIGQVNSYSDPSVPGSEASRTTDAARNTVVTTLGGGTVTIPRAQPQTAPPGGGSGIVANGVPQTNDRVATNQNPAGTFRPGLTLPSATAPAIPTPTTRPDIFSPGVSGALAAASGVSPLNPAPAPVAPAGFQNPAISPALGAVVNGTPAAIAAPFVFPTVPGTPAESGVAARKAVGDALNNAGDALDRASASAGNAVKGAVDAATSFVTGSPKSATDEAAGYAPNTGEPSDLYASTPTAPAPAKVAAAPSFPAVPPSPTPAPTPTIQPTPPPVVASETPSPAAPTALPAPSTPTPAPVVASSTPKPFGASTSYVPPPTDEDVRRAMNGGVDPAMPAPTIPKFPVSSAPSAVPGAAPAPQYPASPTPKPDDDDDEEKKRLAATP